MFFRVISPQRHGGFTELHREILFSRQTRKGARRLVDIPCEPDFNLRDIHWVVWHPSGVRFISSSDPVVYADSDHRLLSLQPSGLRLGQSTPALSQWKRESNRTTTELANLFSF